MACDCDSKVGRSEFKDGICEVCRLIDNDTTVKKVKYCPGCGANICCNCDTRYDKRFFAMLRLKFKF